MKRPLTARLVVGAALAAALGVAGTAQAHTDVFFSIGLPGQAVYVEPQPVYVQPRPVYVQPQPVYVQPRPIYVQPPAYVYERPWRPSYSAEFEREREWQRAEWQRREWKHRHQHHERDGYRSHDRDRD